MRRPAAWNFTGSRRAGKASSPGRRLPGQFLHQPTLDVRSRIRSTIKRRQRRTRWRSWRFAGGRFEGKSAAGHAVTLARPLRPVTAQRKSHVRISALLLCPVRQCLSRRADAQSDRRRLEADVDRLLRRRRAAQRRTTATDVNEMGEVPVLVDGKKKLTPVRRDPHLSRASTPANSCRKAKTKNSKRCAGSSSTTRRSTAFSARIASSRTSPSRAGDPAVIGVSQRPHRRQSRDRQQAAGKVAVPGRRQADHRRHFDVRLICITRRKNSASISRKDHPAIGAWLERIKALPGWAHPYDLMPGYPFGTQGYRNQ